MEAKRVAHRVCDSRARQALAEANSLRGEADETVHIRQAQTRVRESSLYALPVKISLVACREVALLRNVDASHRSVIESSQEATSFSR
jgi:hypothetical protein